MKERGISLLLLLAAACCLAAAPARAGTGTAGGEFLRIVQSPRAVGMGETGAGLYGELLGAFAMNPASLARSGYREVALTYNSWLEGIALQQAGYAHPLGGNKGVVGGALTVLSMPSIRGYNNAGAAAGDVDAMDAAVSANYAVRLSGPWQDRRLGLFAGGAVKYARQQLDSVSAGAALFDAGLLWVLRAPGGGTAGLGVAAQSLGGGFKFDSVSDKAPAVTRAGASYILLAAGDPLTFAADIKKPSDSGTVFSLGAEYMFRRVVSLRAGYISGEDLGGGLRFGGGVALKLLQFDYAVSSYGKFGSAHRFSLAYKFGKPVEVTPHLSPGQEKAKWKTERARELMRESRYYEAVLELNEALGLDPGSAEALELMRRARGLVEVSK